MNDLRSARRPRLGRCAWFFSLAAAVFGQAAVAADELDVKPIWESLRSNSLDFDRAVRAGELAVDMGAASLTLRSGTLIPARPVLGRTTEVVFVGDAEFVTAPDDPIERRQLDLFSGSEALRVGVRSAVLVIGNDEVLASLLKHEAAGAIGEETRSVAAGLYSDWVGGAVRRGFGADGAQLKTLVGDRLYDGFFLAWCRSDDLGDFYYALDPGEAEQITLGQFVPIELDDREEYRIRKEVRRQQRRGRFAKLNVDDLGEWNTWMSMSRTDSTGTPFPGGSGFESRHYTIDATLDPPAGKLHAVSETQVRAVWGGARVLTFDVFRDTDVVAVTTGDGVSLPWIHSEDGLLVILPEAPQPDATTTVTITYDSTVLGEYEKGIYVLQDTYSWYPRIGDVDRATYDVTLRWPRKHQLLASGRVVDSGSDGKDVWERRRLDVAAIAFSFEVGDFEIHEFEAGRVHVTLGFSRTSGTIEKGSKQRILDHVTRVLPFFEETFGEYPLDYLTVATVPRGFSQGFLGFVTLTHFLVTEQRGWIFLSDLDAYHDSVENRLIETVAHELAHQWWGNKVGWDGYRDQWLSEALADFAAMLYAADQAERQSVYLASRARQWKSTLLRTVLDGRSVESIGPVVLGSRLASSKSSTAYSAIVYRKGSLILHMLSQAIGPEPFAAMLKSLADAVDNRVIDTPTFLKSIERMSGADLAHFRRLFVYGTGVPEVYYTYEISKREDDSWAIDGEARLVTPGHFEYVLETTESGGWRIRREHVETVDLEDWALAVPFQIALASREDETYDRKRGALAARTATQRGLGGRLVLQGETTGFSIPLAERPERFWFDQRGEVLVSLYSDRDAPKKMLRYRAIELANAKRFAEAEELYRQALTAPVFSEQVEEGASKRLIERETDEENALIHIALARMFIDMDRDADAVEELDRADSLLTGLQKGYYEISRMVLRAHLAIRAGDYRSAYRTMEKSVYLDFPFRYDDSMAAQARRRRFASRGRSRLSGLGYAVFAVAAHETGNEEIARQAAKEAAERGAVMSALEQRFATDPAS